MSQWNTFMSICLSLTELSGRSVRYFTELHTCCACQQIECTSTSALHTCHTHTNLSHLVPQKLASNPFVRMHVIYRRCRSTSMQVITQTRQKTRSVPRSSALQSVLALALSLGFVRASVHVTSSSRVCTVQRWHWGRGGVSVGVTSGVVCV